MKKNIIPVLLASFLMLISMSVKAQSTCSSAREMELSSLANNVNADYEEYDKLLDPEVASTEDVGTTPAFYIKVYNLTSDLNLKVTLDGSKNSTYVNSSDADADGIIYLDTSYANSVKNYTLTIRSNDSSCKNEILRTITITIPMRNYFATYSDCDDMSDFYLCQEFTTTDYSDVSDKDFTTKLNDYKENKAAEEKKENSITYKTFDFIKTYRGYFILIIAIVVAILVFIKVKKAKEKRRLI